MYEVKPRYDGKGDGWANAHRDLGPTFNMNDADALMGVVSFAWNTGERLFIEDVPDNYINRYSSIREFAYVALFDRKTNLDFALSNENAVSRAMYLHLCRIISAYQPLPPRFFFVIGGQCPPWEMHEIAIDSSEPKGDAIILPCRDGSIWRSVWETCGLKSLRDELRKWIDQDRGNRWPANG